MNAHTDIAALDGASEHDLAVERAQARLRDLEEVRAICMSVARIVQKQALAQGDLQDVGDLAGAKAVLGGNVVTLAVRGDFGLVIEKVARAVRLTVILEQKQETIIRDLKAGVVAAAREGLVRRRRGAVERVMMTTIRAKHGGFGQRTERDRERLEDYLGQEDFIEQPVSAIVRRLCNLMGLKPDWSRWADEAWAEEEAEAGVVGSPYRAAGVKPTAHSPDAAPPADSS